MKGQRETLDQPGQEEERSGKPLHWSCLEVTLELNPKRPVGVIQVEKKRWGSFPAKEVSQETHGGLREYGTVKEVQVYGVQVGEI